MEPLAHNTPLPLRNAYNVRDLGGYACADGAITRVRAFLRGDDLSSLSPEDIQQLWDYGVRTVIDLRGEDECAQRPNPFAAQADVAYHNLPLGLDRMEDITRYLTQAAETVLLTFYQELITQRRAEIRHILEVMANASPGTVLFHCMAGKDRTGIIAALLLGLVGVTRADIVANYRVSYDNIQHCAHIQQAMRDYAPELFHSPPHIMESLLDFIDNQYGSISDYLNGMEGADWRSLRERLCAPAESTASATSSSPANRL